MKKNYYRLEDSFPYASFTSSTELYRFVPKNTSLTKQTNKRTNNHNCNSQNANPKFKQLYGEISNCYRRNEREGKSEEGKRAGRRRGVEIEREERRPVDAIADF